MIIVLTCTRARTVPSPSHHTTLHYTTPHYTTSHNTTHHSIQADVLSRKPPLQLQRIIYNTSITTIKIDFKTSFLLLYNDYMHAIMFDMYILTFYATTRNQMF